MLARMHLSAGRDLCRSPSARTTTGISDGGHMIWTDERVATLKRLWGEGLSASQIAGRLGGVTRNACIGKAHRLGLVLRGKPLKDSVGQSYRPKNMTRRQARISTLRSTATSPLMAKSIAAAGGIEISAPSPEPVRLTTDEPTLVSYAQLEAHHCRFIPGEPAGEHTRYCGCRTVEGLPYCETHAVRAFAPKAAVKPASMWTDPPVRQRAAISSGYALAFVRG